MNHHDTHFLKLLPLFMQTLIRLGAHRSRSRVDQDLTYLQMGVLGAVFHRARPTMGEVAADTYTSPPAATRLTGELVDRGLLERVPDPADRRIVRLAITDAGLQLLHQLHEEEVSLLMKAIDRMSEDERDALAKGLAAFLNAVAEVEQSDTPQNAE